MTNDKDEKMAVFLIVLFITHISAFVIGLKVCEMVLKKGGLI